MNVGNNISVLTGGQWSFDHDVACHFDEHVQQSVPLYNEGHELVCFLSDFFLRDRSTFYEIGSSTGALINKIYNRHGDKELVKLIGIEPVKNMISEAIRKNSSQSIEYINDSIENISLEKSSLIVSYYCIQFTPIVNRGDIYKKVYQALLPGGAFILFEKEIIDDSKVNEMIESCYLKFKMANGFSADEVISKKFSLEGMMRPGTGQENIALLMASGFKTIETIMKYGEFHGYLCIK